MEGLVLLIVGLLGLVVVVAPLLSVIGFLRGRAARAELAQLRAEVRALEALVHNLATAVAQSPPSQGAQESAGVRRPPVPEAPPPVPDLTAVAPQAGPRAGGPAADTIPPIPPPIQPPLPPDRTSSAMAADAPPPEPPRPGFDWESLLGVRGAAWLGGVTLVIAALFFAKWSIDQGFFSPPIRIALMLVSGTAALAWAELRLRQGYQTTANAVSGAGVVTLYAAFFAGHSLYQLFPLPVAFGGMSVVTVLAGVIAIRYRAFFTAVIGLAGGLATPVLLSTGVDRPIGFFAYLVLLATGFLLVAERCRWSSITVLALAGTTLLELGWHAAHMAADKLIVGTVAYAALGSVYLWHAVRTREHREGILHETGVIGSLVPFAFAAILAADSRFVAQWTVLAAFLSALDSGLIWAALRWQVPWLVTAASMSTALSLYLLGGTHALNPSGLWGLSAFATATAVAFNLVARLPSSRHADWLAPSSRLSLVVGGAGLAGILAFAWRASEAGLLPVWAFLMILGCALWISTERTSGRRWPGAFGAGVLLTALSASHWVAVMGDAGNYLDHLTIPHLVAIAVAIIAVRRHDREDAQSEWWKTDDAAILAAATAAYWIAAAGLDMVSQPSPARYFLLVGLDVALVVGVAVHASWTGLVPAAALAAVGFEGGWHTRYFRPETAAVSIAVYLTFYGLFLVLPFYVSRAVRPAWKARPAPWLVAALIGPASFPLFYAGWVQLVGRSWVGLVPVVMAAISVTGLYAISRSFQTSDDDLAARRRLNYLALFAAVALGFIAAAIPLQLERQWITIGWALEAMAVWWLFARLPHPGLKYFGLTLYLAVGLRLLANPEVLRYQPRGRPVLNWLLYTYGIPAACCLAGAWLLPRAEKRRGPSPDRDWVPKDRAIPAPLVGLIGVLIGFWLINLEIADYYSAGRYVEFDLSRHLARDLTRSFAWGLYALTLLGVGLWRVSRGLRLLSLAFLLLTVAKVFLYDLGQLTGLYRIVSFLALGLALILVSLLYQRFVRREEATA